MNIAEMLGTPVADDPSLDTLSESRCAVPPTTKDEPEPAKRRLRWLAWPTALLATLAVGFGAGTYLATPATGSPPPMQTADSATAPAPVGDFAELFTSLHLTGLTSPTDMAQLYSGESPATATGMWVNRSAAVAIRPLDDGLWVATVAVDALELVDGAYEAAGLQYFEVTIDSSGNRPVAISAPARIPAPAASPASGASPAFAGTVPPDQLAAVTAFFETYLTGRGELARYVSTTAQIPVFATAPYESISMAATAADSLGRIRVDIDAVTASGGKQHLQYVAELTFERGVWEVADLVPAVRDRG